MKGIGTKGRKDHEDAADKGQFKSQATETQSEET